MGNFKIYVSFNTSIKTYFNGICIKRFTIFFLFLNLVENDLILNQNSIIIDGKRKDEKQNR